MAFGIGDELSVRVGADTADFTAGMARAQNRLDEVSDEADEASRSFTRLAAGTNGLSASFGLLGSSAIGATGGIALLSTALLPLVATLGALAAGAGAVAGAFGILVGAGVITHMDELKTAFQETKEEVLTLIQPLGEVFGPVLVDAVEAIPSLVEESLAAIGSVEEFRDILVGFGEATAGIIPQLVGGMFELARQALPLLRQGFQWIQQNGPRIFQGIMRVVRRVGPLLMDLARAIIGIIPELTKIGVVVASVVIPALTNAIKLFDQILTAVINFGQGSSKMRQQLVSALTTINKITRRILGGLRSFWNKWGDDITKVVTTLATQAASVISDLFSRFESVWDEVGAPLLGEGGEIEGALNSLKSFWNDWGDEISAVFTFLFDSILGIAQTGFDLLITTVRVILDVIQGDWEGALNNIAGFFQRTFNGLLDFASKWGQKFIDAFIGALPDELKGSVRDAIGTVSDVSVPSIDVGLPQPANQGQAGQESVTVERREVVQFEGDGQITQAMAEQANQQIESRERRTERNSGRQTGP